MIVDLMSTTTSDGIELDGAFFAPQPGVSPTNAVDAILLAHGSRGNFCMASTKHMAEDLQARGYACLALNSAAHDNDWNNRGDGNNYGNGFEILDRSRLDIRAGVDYPWDLGYRRIGILGHSMGAVRVTYYSATETDHRVAAVIPVSPVRLSYSYYMASTDAAEFQSIVQHAGKLEADGKSNELISVKFPITQLFSATSYLDKHGPGERYNLINLAPKITIPMFVLAGSLETHTRLLDMAGDLASAAVNSPEVRCVIVEGGSHSLANRRQEAAAVVLDWLASLASKPVEV